MKTILKIFDTSPYIYGGHPARFTSAGVIDTPEGYIAADMPTGGVAFALSTVKTFLRKGTDVVYVIDSTPTHKRKIYQQTYGVDAYKKRPHNIAKVKGIQHQRDMLFKILRLLELDVFRIPGYEADDIIAWLVAEYKHVYDEIHIHQNDKDLYGLIDDNVEVHPVGNKGKHVTKQNYSFSIFKDNTLEYNLIWPQLILMGDKVDNIPALPKDVRQQITDNIDFSRFSEQFGDPDYVRSKFELACPTDLVRGQVDLILPLAKPDSVDLGLYSADTVDYRYDSICQKFGNKGYNNLPEIRYPEGDSLITECVREYAMEVN